MDDRNQCLDPSFGFKTLDNFEACFHKWTDGYFVGPDNGAKVAVTTASSNETFAHIIHTCISKYCERPDNNLGGCANYSRFENNIVGNTFELESWHRTTFRAEACLGLNQNANADIGGPGATASYIMQAVIILYIWLAMRLLKILPAIVTFFANLPYRMGPNTTTMNAHNKQTKTYLTTRFEEHLIALYHVLVEFQEAQCFFMIALAITTLVSSFGDTSFFQASNQVQFERNLIFSRIVSLGAIVPVTLGLLLLHEVGMQSLYTLLWSTITIIISTVVFYRAGNQKTVAKDLMYPQKNTGLAECGYRPPPIVWCASNIYPGGATSVLVPLHSISLFIFVVLALVQFWPLGGRLFQRKSSATDHGRVNWFLSLPGWAKLTLRILRVITELVLVGMILFYDWFMSSWVALNSSMPWNFGQVVAMFIWAPAIFKYIHWSFFGTRNYSNTRIPEPYGIANSGYALGNRSMGEDNMATTSNSPASRTDVDPIERQMNEAMGTVSSTLLIK